MSVFAIKAEKPFKQCIIFYICIAHYLNQGLCISRLWGAVTVWNTPSSTCLSQCRMQKHIKYPFPWWLSGLSRAPTVAPVYCAALFHAEELTCDNKRQITCKRPRFVTPVCLSGPEQGIQPQTLWFLSVLHQRNPFECLRPSPQRTKHRAPSVLSAGEKYMDGLFFCNWMKSLLCVLNKTKHAISQQTLLPESQHSEDLNQDSMASVAKTPLSGKRQ